MVVVSLINVDSGAVGDVFAGFALAAVGLLRAEAVEVLMGLFRALRLVTAGIFAAGDGFDIKL